METLNSDLIFWNAGGRARRGQLRFKVVDGAGVCRFRRGRRVEAEENLSVWIIVQDW